MTGTVSEPGARAGGGGRGAGGGKGLTSGNDAWVDPAGYEDQHQEDSAQDRVVDGETHRAVGADHGQRPVEAMVAEPTTRSPS